MTMMSRAVLLAALILLALVGPTPSPAQEANAAFRFEVPLDLSQFNPCTSETVAIIGAINFTITVASDANGGFHVTTHSLVKGKGVGQSSGKKYVFVGETSFSSSFNGACCQSESTLVQEVVLISQSGRDNQRLQITSHIALNANGQATATVDNARFVCQG
jgi:hypothetical protein